MDDKNAKYGNLNKLIAPKSRQPKKEITIEHGPVEVAQNPPSSNDPTGAKVHLPDDYLRKLAEIAAKKAKMERDRLEREEETGRY